MPEEKSITKLIWKRLERISSSFFFFFVILMLERIYKFNKITIKYSIIQKLKGIKKLQVKN